MPTSLTQRQIEEKLTGKDLDELLRLYWTGQGAEKRRDLELMAAAVPFPRDAPVRVLDLCCGPGDVGRAVRARDPNARIDCIDRDAFLISICIRIHRREKVSGQTVVRDLWEADWHEGLQPYDVVGMPVSDWVRMLREAGFASIDVLLRDADEVMLAAVKE